MGLVLFESRTMTSTSELLLRGVTIVTVPDVAASRALPSVALTSLQAMQHVRFTEALYFRSNRERTSCQDNIKDVKKKYPLFMIKPVESAGPGWCMPPPSMSFRGVFLPCNDLVQTPVCPCAEVVHAVL